MHIYTHAEVGFYITYILLYVTSMGKIVEK